jgi:hypothetical protein
MPDNCVNGCNMTGVFSVIVSYSVIIIPVHCTCSVSHHITAIAARVHFQATNKKPLCHNIQISVLAMFAKPLRLSRKLYFDTFLFLVI